MTVDVVRVACDTFVELEGAEEVDCVGHGGTWRPWQSLGYFFGWKYSHITSNSCQHLSKYILKMAAVEIHS